MKCCCCGNLNSGVMAAVLVAVLSGTVLTYAGQPEKKKETPVQPAAQPAAKPTHGDPVINTLTDAEKKAGWVLLFDGKSMEHFKGFKTDAVPASWEAQNGTLHAKGSGGDILTKHQYKDFEFACEWKVPEGGNSGIIYRVAEEGGATYETGPEFQVLDNAKHKDKADPKTTAGSLYGLYAPTKDMTKPAGEWNTAKIVVKGTKVEHWWNGEKVVDADMGSEEFKKLVAGSKFNAWKGFAVQPKGFIALQDHGDQVWYRNIKIREIK
ncbi:MAG: hypothetical protein GIKADHBN_02436 [Phycisphaerales bacterium]|nr:hypothetical protein [Phycisphaerales bacterium]